MYLHWLPNRDKGLATPARQFFSKPVIQADTEQTTVYKPSQNPMSQYVEFLFDLPDKKRQTSNLGELLSLMDVKYVVVAKEMDWRWYEEYLSQQQDMTLFTNTANLLVYKNSHETSRMYQLSDVKYIDGWQELLERSEHENLRDSLYVHGAGEAVGSGERGLPLSYQAISPARYLVEAPVRNYLVFVPPQQVAGQRWSYDGQEQMTNNGFLPAFASADGQKTLMLPRFQQVLLPSYGVSLAALVGLALVLLWQEVGRQTPVGGAAEAFRRLLQTIRKRSNTVDPR